MSLSASDREFVVRVLAAHAALTNSFSGGDYARDAAAFASFIMAFASGQTSPASTAERDQRL
jgi:hypothetical protein